MSDIHQRFLVSDSDSEFFWYNIKNLKACHFLLATPLIEPTIHYLSFLFSSYQTLNERSTCNYMLYLQISMLCIYFFYGNHPVFFLALFMKRISSKNTFHAPIYSCYYQFYSLTNLTYYQALKKLFNKYKILPMTKTKPRCKGLQYLSWYVFNLH